MERGHRIEVPPHGAVTLIDYMGSDEMVIGAARMSTGRGFEGWEQGKICRKCRRRAEDIQTGIKEGDYGRAVGACGLSSTVGEPVHDMVETPGDLKLLADLYSGRGTGRSHASPFGTAGAIHLEIQAPIFVFRQIHRHRTQMVVEDDFEAEWNEFSARYAQMPDLHWLPTPERVQEQSKTNKQGSGEPLSRGAAESWIGRLQQEQESIYSNYDHSVGGLGIAKEIARANTPVSRYSKMRGMATLRNWLLFLNLRLTPETQQEDRDVANAVAEIVEALFPRTYALFLEWDLHGVKLSRSEVESLRRIMRDHAYLPADQPLLKKLGYS